jgi:putative transposase
MKRKIHTAEQIVNKLREADAFMAKGGTLDQVSRQLGISNATYYNWRKQYGQMKLDQEQIGTVTYYLFLASLSN